MKPNHSLPLFFLFSMTLSFIPSSHASAMHDASSSQTSMLFSSPAGTSTYAFDIYSLPLWEPPSISTELRLTDGHSLNFNGHFPSPAASSIVSLPPNQSPFLQVIYATQRNGTSRIYLDVLYSNTAYNTRKRSILEARTESTSRVQVPLVGPETTLGRISLKDRPSLVGDTLVYVSTHEDPYVPRGSWTAVYSTQLDTGSTKRLTPNAVADFSPAVSPSGIWTAVASYGEKTWAGEVEELNTDIYLFVTLDGSNRVKVVEQGGWPTWSDDSTLYFHRRSEDGWWSVYRAIFPGSGELSVDSVMIERVSPPGLHAFTPAASAGNKRFIAVATRRHDSRYRHIELYDVVSNEFRELTRSVSPNAHHFNPFISPDFTRVGYHRCRGADNEGKSKTLMLENFKNPITEIPLFLIDGSFPSFSQNGERIAYVTTPGLYVVNSDGSGNRKVLSDFVFATAWDPKRKGVVYTSFGPPFAGELANVDIISVNVDEEQANYKVLTTGGGNNAFPWASPDGKWVVFRSGRSGHKNLYIMDAINGERGGLHRLTEGPWTDTMCNWSPNGEWIAFASDRENPGSFSFSIFMIHPNGTGLRKLFDSGPGGVSTHPYFSPDSKRIVFTTDFAGVSSEPISNSDDFAPYGEIFTITLEGTGLGRLTHNSFQDGTPAWGSKFMSPVDVESSSDGPQCAFEDCQFLNISPSLGIGNASISSTKTPCSK